MIRYIKEEEHKLDQFGTITPFIGPLSEKMNGINIQVSANGSCDVMVLGSIDNKVWHELLSATIETPYSPFTKTGEADCNCTYIPLTGDLLLFRWYRLKLMMAHEKEDITYTDLLGKPVIQPAYHDILGKPKKVTAFISGIVI